MNQEIRQAYEWYALKQKPGFSSAVCQTRDVFQARLDRFYRDLEGQTKDEANIALLSALVGELGNNCFDHNLGQWRDVPGCWYAYGVEQGRVWVTVVDRGQGLLATLRRVDPTLKDDQQALQMAFHKRVSGRSPEHRGNGLKFVRGVINGSKERGLHFSSGKGTIGFGGWLSEARKEMEKLRMKEQGRGAFALVLWKAKL